MEEEDIRAGRRGEFCVEKWPRGRWKYYDGRVFRLGYKLLILFNSQLNLYLIKKLI